VSDRLNPGQHALGFLSQSAYTGLAQTLAYLTPSLLVMWGLDKNALGANHIPQITVIAFVIGSVFSITTVVWSVWSTPELPLSAEALAELRARPTGWRATLSEIVAAVRDMPAMMRRLWWMKLFQWYGMLCYWIYVVPCLARSVFDTTDANSEGFRDASLLNGEIGGFYNFVAFVSAFALVPLSRRFGPARVHALCLTLAGLGMAALPSLQSKALLFIPMLGVGLAWASIMGNPYILLASSIPKERAGVYMGLFNMFIVLPMILQMLSLPLYFNTLLAGDPRNVLRLAGGLLVVAAGFSWRLHRRGG
jgi:maltose/moltooligosaccharide transporter